jgi:hypothetical protein
MTTMEQLIQAVLAAPEDRKEAALKALRGDPEPERSTVQGKGPLLMGMSAGAKFLGVSRATLWRVLRAGKIQKVELFPGSFRVRREDLESLAAGALGMSENKSLRGRNRKEVVMAGK